MGNSKLQLSIIQVNPPIDANLILAQSHFIKTVEDVHEALIDSVPNIKFGIAFCESSGPCLVRVEGNDPELVKFASQKAYEIGAGHFLIVAIRNSYPINVLTRLREVPEICNIYAATANPLQVVVAETSQGRGIMGVVDGLSSKGIEQSSHVTERKQLLRRIGYKL